MVLASASASCSKKTERRERVRDEDGEDRPRDASRPSSPVFTNDDEAAALPASVLAYRRFSIRYYSNASMGFRDPETPEAAWSKMARDFCGGEDLYGSMSNAGVSKYTGGTIGRAIKDLDKTREQVVCGKTIAAALGPRVVRLRVREPGESEDLRAAVRSSYIAVRELSLDALPMTSNLAPMDGGPAFEKTMCMFVASDPDCSKSSSFLIGKLPRDRSWLVGPSKESRAFGAALADTSRAPHPRAKQMLALAKSVASFQAAEVGVAPGFNLGFVNGLGVRFDAMKNVDQLPCSKALQKALLERDVTYAFGDGVNPFGGAMRIVLQPEDASQVDALLADIQAWHAAILEHLRPYQPTALVEGMMELEKNYQTLIHVWAMRSLEEAKITREGDTVVLEFERRLTPSERETVDAMQTLNTKRAERGAEMMRLLLEGKEPPASLFDGIGAVFFAADVAKGRASKTPR